ncbi:helix-turn-helix transcriptional regulator [Anaerosacchariphilus polymeriproducens]|uniref:XRE family transcriptional regulator n=1 Tax=Anaerosacchariphilus polymeriproducens TaxID=1812858 RepID=A0A371AYT8_9FIRM|nr:helix-turn-helix transcriptional regulator [Anaerosacchariphilus polymeriproducens]RDU24764.1 XRE family transcriptional regulator [Anaerosacchariphilus polymeriproducens]
MKKAKDKFYKLEYYRNKYGISQQQMAGIIGVKASCYSHKVNKRSSFSLPQMIDILNVLNKEAKKAGDNLITLDEIFLP